MSKAALAACGLLLAAPAHPQTLVDRGFDTSVGRPAFVGDDGPRVLFDEGHDNWHKASDRYAPAASVLENDGFRVAAHRGKFTADSLAGTDVLVIVSPIEGSIARAMADGIDAEELASWSPPLPSAFSADEIAVLADWVNDGGSVLLIVDYMPLAGMSANLASAFGVHFADGYAYDGAGENNLTFTRAAGSLRAHAVTEGRHEAERIDSVRTFGGTALLVPHNAEPLLLFGDSAYIVLPETLLPPDTPPPADARRHPIAGWSQGAALEVGRGRVAVFGEHAMFTAQRFPNGAVTGMNDPAAAQNKQLLLNVTRWLADAL